MEYMDAGSLDKLEAGGIPEPVLGRIAGSMVRGLKFLKDQLEIIHRGMSSFPRCPISSSITYLLFASIPFFGLHLVHS